MLRQVVERLDLAPVLQEGEETVVTLLTVCSLSVLAYFGLLLTEVQEGYIYPLLGGYPRRNSEDVYMPFIVHLIDNLTDIVHQLIEGLVEDDGIHAVHHPTALPFVWIDAYAGGHILLSAFKGNT